MIQNNQMLYSWLNSDTFEKSSQNWEGHHISRTWLFWIILFIIYLMVTDHGVAISELI